MKFNIELIRKSVEKIQVSLKSDKIKGTSNEVQYTFVSYLAQLLE